MNKEEKVKSVYYITFAICFVLIGLMPFYFWLIIDYSDHWIARGVATWIAVIFYKNIIVGEKNE